MVIVLDNDPGLSFRAGAGLRLHADYFSEVDWMCVHNGNFQA